MVKNSITLLCYWNGRISHGAQGITYVDAIPKATKVSRGIKYSELMDKMFKLTRIDSQQHKLKIICRYQANGQYIALHIDGDESVNVMLDMTKQGGVNCVEIYLEKTNIFLGTQSDLCSAMNNGSFTQLLTQEDDANDPSVFGMRNEHVSLSPFFRFYFEETCGDFEINTSQNKCSQGRIDGHNEKCDDLDAQHSNVFSARIQETLEVENIACVIEGTYINNELVEDETEEDLHEIDLACATYKEAPVPEFTNIERANAATNSQWFPMNE